MEKLKNLKKGEVYNAPQTEFIKIDSEQSTLLSVSLGFNFGGGFGDETPLF